ncbi:MAG TPA: hypothetical protein VN256_17865 [Pyrinomonadaceae bacterium]|nr:hypothetical protein [Pyrinomonadaceae bacterium]
MKRVPAFLTFAFVVLLTACSYTSNFVFINATDQPVELRYKVKASPRDPLEMVGTPRKTAAEKLRDGDREWRLLAPGEYALDGAARTVTIRVMPHEAVLVRQMTNYGGHDDTSDAEAFAVEEIYLNGARGEVRLQGEQARRSFLKESDNLYTLTYK